MKMITAIVADNCDYLSTLSSLMALSFCPAEVLLKKKKSWKLKSPDKKLFLGAPLVLFRLLGELHAKKFVRLFSFYCIVPFFHCFITILYEEKQAHKLIL